jgi:hypothetical protein
MRLCRLPSSQRQGGPVSSPRAGPLLERRFPFLPRTTKRRSFFEFFPRRRGCGLLPTVEGPLLLVEGATAPPRAWVRKVAKFLCSVVRRKDWAEVLARITGAFLHACCNCTTTAKAATTRLRLQKISRLTCNEDETPRSEVVNRRAKIKATRNGKMAQPNANPSRNGNAAPP